MDEDQVQGTPEDGPQSTSYQVLNEQADGAVPAPALVCGSSASPPPFFKRKRLRVLFLAALIVLGGGGAFITLLVAYGSASFPSYIPLPPQSTLVGQTTCTGHCWYATVDNTTCGVMLDFYTVQLSRQGWSNMKHTSEGDPVVSFVLAASKGDTSLDVSCANETIDSVHAPSGGVVLLFGFP